MQRNDHPVFSYFERWEGETDGVFHTDFLGVRTDPSWWKNTRPQPPGRVLIGYPSAGEQYFEWVFLLETVLACKDRDSFTMIELGAGYGPWLLRAHHAFRQYSDKPVHLVGVEGDRDHYLWMREHFRNNGLDPEAHRLLHACASDIEGAMTFLVSDDPSSDYGQRIGRDHRQREPGELGTTFRGSDGRRYRNVRAVPLGGLVRSLARVDLIHMDIQGYEYKVVSRAIDDLDAKVGRMIIGSHSEEIERDLRLLLSGHGWRSAYDFPRRALVETEWGRIQFRDGCQAWVNEKLESQPG